MNNSIQKTLRYIGRKYYYEYLSANDILKYTVIKGEPLSTIIYKDEVTRITSDIDLLIPKKQIETLKHKLYDAEFKPISHDRYTNIFLSTQSHQISPWIMRTPHFGTITIDINYDIYWGEYEGSKIDIEEFLSDTIEISIFGVKVKTLSPIKAMIQLALHHYKDANSIYLIATRNSINQGMFKDIYYLLKNNQHSITPQSLYIVSEKYNATPYVYYILYYTRILYPDEMMTQYERTFYSPIGKSLLNCYGLCEKERKLWRYDFETRLKAKCQFNLIKADLTSKDLAKIELNKRMVIGEIG